MNDPDVTVNQAAFVNDWLLDAGTHRVLVLGDFTAAQQAELDGWSGALGSEPSWLRTAEQVWFYWHRDDPAAAAQDANGLLVNLAAGAVVHDYEAPPGVATSYRPVVLAEV